jgi:hypothetical protein
MGISTGNGRFSNTTLCRGNSNDFANIFYVALLGQSTHTAWELGCCSGTRKALDGLIVSI